MRRPDWPRWATPCASGTRRGCAEPLTSSVRCCSRSPRLPVTWRRTSKITRPQGQLEEAQPLVERLETMTQELMRLAGGLSLETLRQQAEAAADQ